MLIKEIDSQHQYEMIGRSRKLAQWHLCLPNIFRETIRFVALATYSISIDSNSCHRRPFCGPNRVQELRGVGKREC